MFAARFSSFVRTLVLAQLQSLPDFLDLRRMALGMHRHCNEHFTNADHPCGWMRMFYLAGAQIFRVLLKEPDHTRARGFKFLSSLCQSGKPTDGPGSFRRFHLVSAVWNHL